MKNFIKNKVRGFLNEQMIDGQDMNPHLQSLCNTMTVNSYDEVIETITAAIGPKKQNPELWGKIQKPLEMLKQANTQINQEKHTDMMGNHTNNADGMTGDSMVDEADTYWHMIQSTLCEQGPKFK